MYMYIWRINPAQVNVYVCVCICTYMMVYACIGMYKYVYTYMYVFSGMTPSDTGTDATSLKNTLRGRQSAGHTQGTPGHLGFHFIQQLAKVVHTRFGAPHPAARVLGP